MFAFAPEISGPGWKSWKLLHRLLDYMLRDEQDMIWLYGNGLGPIHCPKHDALMMKRQADFFAARARRMWRRRIVTDGVVILPMRKVA